MVMEQITVPEPSREPEEAPETPSTEPPPMPVQDPPAEPGPAPYVVRGFAHNRKNRLTDVAKDRTMINGERKERRGFASMSPEKQREIASKGGRAAHQKGTAHEWTSDEARNAGRKGGQISRGGRGRLVEPTGPMGETATDSVGE
jgi:general stress protein YciG